MLNYPIISTLISAPSEEPVTVEEFMENARIDDGDTQSTVIASCLKSARELAEMYMDRAIMTQEWDLFYGPITTGGLYISRPVIQDRGIGSPPVYEPAIDVYITDENGVETLLDTTVWFYHRSWVAVLYLRPTYGSSVWPTNIGIRVRVTSGWLTKADVPEAIKRWIMITAGDLYENREASNMKPVSPHQFVNGLLDKYRLRRI